MQIVLLLSAYFMGVQMTLLYHRMQYGNSIFRVVRLLHQEDVNRFRGLGELIFFLGRVEIAIAQPGPSTVDGFQ